MTQPIALWGMMGSGKSTVGKALAERLARPFVDVDAVLVDEFGGSIADFFAEHGEAAFRQREAAVVRRVLDEHAGVVALGGGALLDDDLLVEVNTRAQLVVLQAPVTTLQARLAGDTSRPLLDDRHALQAKLFERAEAYGRVPLQANGDLQPRDVVDDLVARLDHVGHCAAPQMQLPVRTPGAAYDVLLDDGALSQVAQQTLKLRPALAHVVVVAQGNTRRYADAVAKQFDAVDVAVEVVEVVDGEDAKTWSTVEQIHQACAELGLTRKGCLVAVGGGVVGDVTGFAASTWMRGVDFVQVPTTLLAMVDASVGGKTAINHASGKNLVGAFHFPLLVVADPQTLSTLDERQVRSGAAEMVKHDLLVGAPSSSAMPPAADAIAQSIQVKADVVQEDPFEGGRRALLNLGHTFGHAVEHLSHHDKQAPWLHGEAVAVGMVAAAVCSAKLGLVDGNVVDDVRARLQRLHLPVTLPSQRFAAPDLVDVMALDKKKAGKTLRLVLLHGEDGVVLRDAPDRAVLEDVFAQLLVDVDVDDEGGAA